MSAKALRARGDKGPVRFQNCASRIPFRMEVAMNQISRRRLMAAGAAGLPLAALLADPKLAALADQMVETVSITIPNGATVSAALAVPETTPAGAVVLVHEWWGLNDQIKTMAVELARQGYVGLAVDLYGGQVGTNPDEAKALMGAVDPVAANDTLVGWIEWLRRDARVNNRIGVVGWCFGGGWALNASIATPTEATVIYYGRVERDVQDLKRLYGPVLGHFAERDQWINHAMVDPFVIRMHEAQKQVQVFWYDADHAFANPTGDNYREEPAQLAWKRTLVFLDHNLNR
jgi:carboxymethylenebutenolidase